MSDFHANMMVLHACPADFLGREGYSLSLVYRDNSIESINGEIALTIYISILSDALPCDNFTVELSDDRAVFRLCDFTFRDCYLHTVSTNTSRAPYKHQMIYEQAFTNIPLKQSDYSGELIVSLFARRNGSQEFITSVPIVVKPSLFND